jgi:hypothetical protein
MSAHYFPLSEVYEKFSAWKCGDVIKGIADASSSEQWNDAWAKLWEAERAATAEFLDLLANGRLKSFRHTDQGLLAVATSDWAKHRPAVGLVAAFSDPAVRVPWDDPLNRFNGVELFVLQSEWAALFPNLADATSPQASRKARKKRDLAYKVLKAEYPNGLEGSPSFKELERLIEAHPLNEGHLTVSEDTIARALLDLRYRS